MYGASEVLLRSSYSAHLVPSLDTVVVAAAIVYWIAQVVSTLLLKDPLSVAAYNHQEMVVAPHELLTTGFIEGFASLIGFAVLIAAKLFSKVRPGGDEQWRGGTTHTFNWMQLGVVVGAGAIEGLGHGLAFKSLAHIGFSARAGIDASGILITQMFALMWRLDFVDDVRFFSLFVLFIGGALLSVDNSNDPNSATGVVLRFVSLIYNAGTMVLLQLLLRRTWGLGWGQTGLLTRIKIMALMKPASCLICLILSGVWNPVALTTVTGKMLALWFLIGDIIAIATVCEITALSRTSAVTWNIVVMFTMIPLACFGIFDKAANKMYMWIGFGVWIVGAAIYFFARGMETNWYIKRGMQEDPAAAKHEP
mmetsp:Transcript_73221/g.214651  ORF Transcript_73221/g.214651 Transcript_73221/m.214651 type:complete len:365 (+) Transcript_73221:70-1164(+)